MSTFIISLARLGHNVMVASLSQYSVVSSFGARAMSSSLYLSIKFREEIRPIIHRLSEISGRERTVFPM